MQTIVAVLLVAVASVSASSLLAREKRTGSSGGSSSPLGALAGVPVVGSTLGNVAGGAGGLLGAGVGLTGHNEQNAACTDGTCAVTACTAQSQTNNQASGSGGLIGLGSGVGPVDVNAAACPAVCAQCNQVGAGTIG